MKYPGYGRRRKMKKGLIVYLIDSDSLPETFDGDDAMAHLSSSFDHSVLAASTEGLFPASRVGSMNPETLSSTENR